MGKSTIASLKKKIAKSQSKKKSKAPKKAASSKRIWIIRAKKKLKRAKKKVKAKKAQWKKKTQRHYHQASYWNLKRVQQDYKMNHKWYDYSTKRMEKRLSRRLQHDLSEDQ